ncbi:EamA family transporter [Agromyces sp. CFH 90414]|uniref:EamA family transporter n=1 Tax=Agromyces agglutinans TaxID=2662258 RepID=A0A6I2FGP6_9MICO|nr:EamA family transporter [Agromyces agglutinans]MRG60078.1 EamA family transporter [Agromyces agglutinans]
MLTAVLSLSGALVFGAADFLGGLAAKRIGAILATAVAALTGCLALLAALPLIGGEWRPDDVAWGALSGVVNAAAIGLLYAALAIGPMSILSPLTAVVSAIVPMAWGLASGETLGPLGGWGLAVALVAVVLVGFVPERGAVRPSAKGLALALGSGVAVGAFFVIMDQTSDASGAVPLVMNRSADAAVMFAIAGAVALVGRRRRAGAGRSAAAPARAPSSPSRVDASRRARSVGLRLAVACGLVDVTANLLLLGGLRSGDLTVAAVLGAMYPAGTILLAAIVLRERIAPVQWAGLVLALAAAGMLALA